MAKLAKLSATRKPHGMSRNGHGYNSPVCLPHRIGCLKPYALLTPLPKPPITAAVAQWSALTPLHGLLIPQAAKICSKSAHRSRSLGRWRIAS